MKQLLPLIIFVLFSIQVYGQNLKINEFVSSNISGLKDEDNDYSDWVEIYNPGPAAANLQGYGLSDDRKLPLKWKFPATTLAANSFLLVFASDKNRLTLPNLHTNFKISADGEPLLLSNAAGELLDSIPASIVVPANASYGRKPDGSATFIYFQTPTPKATNNNAAAYAAQLDKPAFSQPAGFYPSSFQLTMTAVAGAAIRYTLDGSEPTESSPLYTGPITIASRAGAPNVLANIRTTTPNFTFIQPASEIFKGTPVRARAFKAGASPSPVTTYSYFVDPNMTTRYTMPVFSVNTTAANLYDPQIGIAVPGNGYDGTNFKTANFFQEGDEWERPAHVEMFQRDGAKVFNQDVGIRVHGNYHTQNAQKSLRFYARKEYSGEEYFNYQLFPDKKINQYKNFVLRNGGGDFGLAYMRDFLVQDLVSHLGPTQAYRPALMFINGEYWGIFDMRERFDKWYFESHYGIDKDSIEILEGNKVPKEGDNVQYLEMLNFAKTNDLSTSANFNQMKTKMDMENFTSHWVAEMIANNTDWVLANIQYFRKKTSAYIPNAPYGQDGRWRWIFWDLDLTLQAPEANNFPTTVDANHWGTELIRTLLPNVEFRNNFINQFADQLNTCFKTEHIIKRADSIAALLEPEMAEHIARWGQPTTVNTWKNNVEGIRNFARRRPNYMRSHVIQRFNLNGTSNIELRVNDASMGKVKINTLTIDEHTVGRPDNAPVYPWSGIYFESVPIPITAIPNPGYRFAGWSDPTLPHSPSISVTIDRDTSFTALFEIDSAATSRPSPFDLATGNYSFTNWPASSAAGTYPAHMLFRRGNSASTDPLLNDAADIDYTAGYNATSQTRINGLGNDGFSFLNTSSGTNLGAAVLALNTLGRTNITVGFTAGTITTTPRDFRIRLQYKVGGGAWTDVPGIIEYTRNTAAGHSQTFSGINLSALTSQAVNNKPAVLLRWKYYNADPTVTTGARPQLRVDEVSVSSTASGALPVVNAGVDKIIRLPANTLTLSGAATDADGNVASYLWTKTAGPTAILSQENTATLQLSNLLEGTYSFQLKATDNAGNTGSDEVIVKVQPANQKPVVSLVSPANNAQLAVGDALVLTAQVSDADGSVAKVQFFRGNVLVSELSSGPYSFTVNHLAAGSYAFTAVAVDNVGASATSAIVNVTVATTTACSASGTILREVWLGAEGNTVSNIPLNTPATTITYPTLLETPSNETDRYGSRLRGYVCAPATGNYTFWIASDNQSELWISTDANPANKVMVASVTGNTVPREWTKYPSQQSAPRSLVAGQKYYIEVLHKESTGGDNLAVGWQLPGGALERPIPGSRLSPFILPANVLPAVSITSPAGGVTFAAGSNITVSANASDGDGAISRVEFYRDNILINEDLSTPYSAVFTKAKAGTYQLRAKAYDNVGGVTTSAAITVTVMPNQLPSVSITSPANGAFFTVGNPIMLTADASDADGSIAQVEFFNGITSLGVDQSAPYEVSIPDAPVGSYSLLAVATDNQGTTSTSAVVNITVTQIITATEPPATAIKNSLTASPNPFSSEVSIRFSSQQSGVAELELYDLQGRRIRGLFQGVVTAGEVKKVEMKSEGLHNGLYLIRLRTSTQNMHYKLVLSK